MSALDEDDDGSDPRSEHSTLPDPLEAARIGAADQVRRLVDALVSRDSSLDDLAAVADVIEPLVERLAAAPARPRPTFVFEAFGPDHQSDSDGRGVAFPGSALAARPILGAANPFSVEAICRIEGEEAMTEVVIGPAFEGAPGRAHGGIVAAILDDVTGHVLQIARTPAFTGSLKVTYHKATPLGRPIQFRARLAGREGRRLHITADVWDGDVRLASCEAVYVTVDPAVFDAAARRAESDSDGDEIRRGSTTLR
jgi:acyl-coenzyme A thioesterase PaaI-like protein